MPKPIPRPKATERDEDVIRKGSKQGSNRRGAPARERRSTDFIVPLGYCQLTSVAFFEFQIYTANQREGLLHSWHDRDNPSLWAAGSVLLDGPDHAEKF